MTRSSINPDRFITALDGLPQLPRIVYLLASRDDYPLDAIAFRIGEDIAAVEEYLSAALTQLVRALDP